MKTLTKTTNEQMQELCDESDNYCPIDYDCNLQSEVDDNTKCIVDCSIEDRYPDSLRVIFDREIGNCNHSIAVNPWW